MIRGCHQCAFFSDCGGVRGNLDLFGCHSASPAVCRKNEWTCPACSPGEYLRRMQAVYNRSRGLASPVGPSVSLPTYVPTLQHRNGWSGLLPLEVAAIPTHLVVGGRGRRFGPLFGSAADLRSKFQLWPRTQLLLISVGVDAFLERYWCWAKATNTAARLAELGVAGITVPNFSFFADAPRFHHIYNRGRLEASLRELAEAGVPVIPHIHALTGGDLMYWRNWLRDHTEVQHVCREFQTGNNEEAIDELAQLQLDIGRPLHPIIVGGSRFADRLRKHFTGYTLVDSTPFMKAMHRQRATKYLEKLRWEPHPTRTPREVGDLLKHNLEIYKRSISPSILQTSLADANWQGMHRRKRRVVRLPIFEAISIAGSHRELAEFASREKEASIS